jgi:TatD DNase family protein
MDLYPDLPTAIREADAAEIFTLAVTTTPRAWPRNFELASKTKHVRAALGLHPQLVAERSGEIDLWESYLPEARYVGEVGIDASPRYYSSIDLQKQVFERILKQCAKAGGKILTVHGVRASALVLDMVEACLPLSKGKVVLHWFTGSKVEARRAVDLGCYFSVNAQMMRNEKGRGLVSILPSDRLLTETDGPFTSHGDRPARPADVLVAIEKMASLRRVMPEKMSETVERNLRALLETTGDLTNL